MEILNNRYKLLEVVGSGGMNTVYKAEDLNDSSLVALKILKHEFLEDEDVIKRFHMESEAIQKLDHENVVKVIDVGKDGNEHYIVMELLKQETLKDLIKQSKRFFNNSEIISMALQILRGIRAAHRHEIVHRDIKPQNILIDENGTLKVSDFGIARVASRNTLHNTKDAIGSVHYASPEQSRGSVVDKRSDIYSFGILLYELSTNRLPFEGDTAISIAIKHTRSDVVNPSYINLNLNKSIEAIILKCMQREPANRFESVDDIITLFEVLEKNPSEDLPPDLLKLTFTETDTIDLASISPYLNEDEEKMPKNNVDVVEKEQKTNIIPIVVSAFSAIALAAVVLMLIFWSSFRDVDSSKPFKLENLIGMNFTEASELMSQKNVKLEQTDAVYDDKIEKNKIISQIPKPDATIKEGATVKVVVSLGKNEVKVPKLIGLKLEEAQVEARNAGIRLKLKNEFSDKEQGTIISQNPKEGDNAGEDGIVTVVVSLGKEADMHFMPNLVGKTRNEAVQALKDIKMVLGLVEPEPSDTIAEGHVTWQSVNSGSEVAEGTVINLKLSSGPNKADGSSVDEKTDNGGGNSEKSEQPDDVTSFFLPLKSEKESYQVKVVKVTDQGEEVVHDAVHASSEGSVRIDVVGKTAMRIKFYIDGELIDEKEVSN